MRSIKRPNYKFGRTREKKNWGAGGAYYGGVTYKGQLHQNVIEHEISAALVGFGGHVTLDKSGNVTDWFIGFDSSFNAQFIFGLEGNFRIGFSK